MMMLGGGELGQTQQVVDREYVFSFSWLRAFLERCNEVGVDEVRGASPPLVRLFVCLF